MPGHPVSVIKVLFPSVMIVDGPLSSRITLFSFAYVSAEAMGSSSISSIAMPESLENSFRCGVRIRVQEARIILSGDIRDNRVNPSASTISVPVK